VSPSLEIADVPENAKSLALFVDDPDAPAKTWLHWLLYDINPLGCSLRILCIHAS
jgi:phosphatidylethanolamine-binding protein (PEBP) family uncharacterized protein